MTQSLFVTGASTGLGRATAKLFAQRGWKVFATMRARRSHDSSDRVSFVAGKDAEATYAQRLAVGVDAFRAGVRKMFLGR